MDSRVALLAVGVGAAAYGCATPEEQTASVSQPRPIERYLTGSRLPLREQDTGAHSVMTADKAAHDEAMQRLTSGSVCPPGGCPGGGRN